MTEMETMAQRRGSMDDSFNLSSFPHMGWHVGIAYNSYDALA